MTETEHNYSMQHVRDMILDDHMAVSPTDVARLEELCPYFTLPGMLMLKRNSSAVSPDRREKLLSRLALLVADKDAFMTMVDVTEAERALFYPLAAPQERISTDTAIDTFLSTYGSSSPEEEALLERLIFNPVPDYSGVLEAQSQALPPSNTPPSAHDALIDAFIDSAKEPPADDLDAVREQDEAENQPPYPQSSPAAKKPAEDTLLSESLAKIFIKQRRYAKAYEIITNLSLNFPEKSIYFADQLRFLHKLIVNQEHNKNAKQ